MTTVASRVSPYSTSCPAIFLVPTPSKQHDLCIVAKARVWLMDDLHTIPELLKRSQDGDQQAAAQLFQRYA
jgi:hypothetical protein